jgi:hypothetical protein
VDVETFSQVSADTLISRLDGVRSTSSGRWLARCPAHDDRRPSLTVRELDDGRTLVHCFGGCAAADVLAAVQLDFEALFPERLPEDRYKPERRPWLGMDAFRAVAFEAELVSLVADSVAHGVALTDADRDRVRLAGIRMRAALEVCGG